MDQRNFDDLMQGKPAQWAEMQSFKGIKAKTPEEKKIKLSLMRASIADRMKPIPENIVIEIHSFIKEQREKGIPEKQVRKMVKDKWNIFVI